MDPTTSCKDASVTISMSSLDVTSNLADVPELRPSASMGQLKSPPNTTALGPDRIYKLFMITKLKASLDFQATLLFAAKALVHARPLLWDGPAPGYTSRLRWSAAWREVARIVYPDWNKHSRLQKLIIAKHVETRWSSVRDRFIRERRQLMRRGASQEELCSLRFAPMLRFILNSSRRRQAELVQQPAEASSDEKNEEPHLTEALPMTPPPRWQEGPAWRGRPTSGLTVQQHLCAALTPSPHLHQHHPLSARL
ncbi:uncharacterized protein [Dendropsophus ebraccatus]|uniref:uncharacterized protein n=1 Tax=Dendropsophus ebraccatus TaxID=150705 RepID=UPI003831D4D9